jgi:site-specific DNA recombinase
MNGERRRCFGYIRVSSDGQKGEDRDGLKRQERAIAAFSKSQGFTIAQIFSDEGVSGTIPHNARPEFKRLLAALYGNGTRTVVIEDVDRLGRDAEVILNAIGDFRRAGFTLLTSKGQDLTATGVDARLKTGIDAVIAEYARGQLVERLNAARKRAREERKQYREGRIPYGYMFAVREGIKARVPNDQEQAVIARMRELRAQGQSIARIAALFNENGIKPRAAKIWHPDVIARVLRRVEHGES